MADVSLDMAGCSQDKAAPVAAPECWQSVRQWVDVTFPPPLRNASPVSTSTARPFIVCGLNVHCRNACSTPLRCASVPLQRDLGGANCLIFNRPSRRHGGVELLRVAQPALADEVTDEVALRHVRSHDRNAGLELVHGNKANLRLGQSRAHRVAVLM
jgi:hypothetical protein